MQREMTAPVTLADTSPPRRRLFLTTAAVTLLALAAGGVWWFTRTPAEDEVVSGSQKKDKPPVDQPATDKTIGEKPPAPPTGPPWFVDKTRGSGIDFTFKNGEEAEQFTILESLGGGVALLDYDGDGRLDIFVTGGGYFDGPKKETIKGYPCKLYRNLGDWKFQDVTKEAGLERTWWYTHGAAVADYDRDGWPDLLVTGFGKLAMFHNESDGKGGRRFVDVTEKVGLKDDSWSTSAGWADIDGDGFPDLYVCHYVDWSFANNPVCKGMSPGIARDVCPPQKFKPLLHALFRNDKGTTFRNVSAEHGFKAEGCGLGVVLADLNGDGRPDIYVANDASNNFLFFNRGGKLEEKGLIAGVAVDDSGHYNGSMGTDAGDYDGSGRASLWVTNFQQELHALYRNGGKESFHYESRAAGLGALGQHLVGFGTGFVDVDNDGWEDLVIANGHVLRFGMHGTSYKQRPYLLRNVATRDRRTFEDISPQGGGFFKTPAIGRGVAIGDLDNDGWPDLVFSHTNSPVVLLRNEAAKSNKANWLGVKLVGRDHRDVVGSTVIVEGPTRKFTRFAKGGGSYLSASDPRLLFGLGDSKVKRVTVQWSWGKTEMWENVEANGYWELREGEREAKHMEKQ